jgi:D-arabinose 5-phosphate isomerase GutQ
MKDQSREVSEVVAMQKRTTLEMIDAMESQIDELVTPELVEGISKIYMVGCGDSYLAARGARLFYDLHVGLPVEPIESMEFSRYAIDAMPKGSLVIGISYGGKVSRTIEAIIRARKRGAYTIVTTGYGQRGAALQSDAAIVGSLPGIRQVVDSLDAAVNAKKISMDEVMKELVNAGGVERVAEKLGIHGAMHLALVGMGPIISSIPPLYLIGPRRLLRNRLDPRRGPAQAGYVVCHRRPVRGRSAPSSTPRRPPPRPSRATPSSCSSAAGRATPRPTSALPSSSSRST